MVPFIYILKIYKHCFILLCVHTYGVKVEEPTWEADIQFIAVVTSAEKERQWAGNREVTTISVVIYNF